MDKGVIRQEIEDLSAFVLEKAGPIKDPQKDNEISVIDFQEQVGCSARVARDRLNKMVALGLMERRMASNGNNPPISVYSKIKK